MWKLSTSKNLLTKLRGSTVEKILLCIAILVSTVAPAFAQEIKVPLKREAFSEGKKEERLTCLQVKLPQGVTLLRVVSSKANRLFENEKILNCLKKLEAAKEEPYNPPEQEQGRTAQARVGKIICSFYDHPRKESLKEYAVVFREISDLVTGNDLDVCFAAIEAAKMAEKERRRLIEEERKKIIPKGMHKS